MKTSQEQIEKMIELAKNGMSATAIAKEVKSSLKNSKYFYYVELYKIEDVIKLGKLMYNNASIYMKRKYDKWLSFYESKSNKQTLNSGKGALPNPEQNLSTEMVINKLDRDVQRL